MSLTLLFHRIEDPPTEFESVPPAFLAATLEGLASRGKRATSLRERAPGGVALTFDDGTTSDSEVALPLLAKAGMSATFFVVSSRVGTPGHMAEAQVRALDRAGMEIGSHSATHPYLTSVPADEARRELVGSKRALEAILGREVASFSFPGGEHDRRLVALAREAGYRHIAISRPGPGAGDLVERVNVHSRTTRAELERLLDADEAYLARLRRGYRLRAALKRAIGVERYARLKERILR